MAVFVFLYLLDVNGVLVTGYGITLKVSKSKYKVCCWSYRQQFDFSTFV